MLSITGVADCCRPNCQGEGWPSPAIAAPAPTRAKSAQTMITNAAERLRTGILRMLLRVTALRAPIAWPSKTPSGAIAQVGVQAPLEGAGAAQPNTCLSNSCLSCNGTVQRYGVTLAAAGGILPPMCLRPWGFP